MPDVNAMAASDPLRTYYIAPEGEVGTQAFAVIREAITKEGMVALGRVVLTTRERRPSRGPRR